jgi:predicted nucleotide-binding protein
MRIALFGSIGPGYMVGDPITDIPALTDFCRRLGVALAQSSHALLVGTDDEKTVDRMVVDGILSSGQPPRMRIWVYHQPARRPDQPFAAQSAAHPGTFMFKPLLAARVSASHLRILRDADAAIIIGGGGNSYAAGLAASLLKVRLIPVASFGGAGRLLWQQLSEQVDSPVAKLPSRSTWDHISGTPEAAIAAITREISALPRLMIVHGRSTDRAVVEQVLRAEGVTDPIVLRDRFRAGGTIPETFEREALQADGALVLFTPDDEAAPLLGSAGAALGPVAGPLAGGPVAGGPVVGGPVVGGPVVGGPDEARTRARARQNVILEYGWFWGRLGRDRVLLLMKDELELPSDISGLLYHSYHASPAECGPAIADFIAGIRDR